MSINITVSNQSFLTQAKEAFQNDGRLDKKELESLKKTVLDSKLSPEIKSGVVKFLEQTKKASDGFLGIFGKDISTKELSNLQKLVSSFGNNPIAKELLNSLSSVIEKPSVDTNQSIAPKYHSLEPSNKGISELFSNKQQAHNTNNKISENSENTTIKSNQSFTNTIPANGKIVGTPKATGYYPHNSKMEGGFKDKIGKPLHTLQDFLNGSASYVSIAIDKNLYKNGTVKYGDNFRIPEMEQKYGKKIIFKAVDTGGAFTGKDFGRIDICTANERCSLDKTFNSKLTLIKAD